MEEDLEKILRGYHRFRDKYASGDQSVMSALSLHGQKPRIMVVACSDSRVDPALILQCDPGDLFVVRNVANIVPPFEKDAAHHGVSAALEFGIRILNVNHLILLGHSQCGGIQELLKDDALAQDDFMTSWVSLVRVEGGESLPADDYAKQALQKSYQHCLTFPWIKARVDKEDLTIHLWFFDIQTGKIFSYCQKNKEYKALAFMRPSIPLSDEFS